MWDFIPQLQCYVDVKGTKQVPNLLLFQRVVKVRTCGVINMTELQTSRPEYRQNKNYHVQSNAAETNVNVELFFRVRLGISLKPPKTY